MDRAGGGEWEDGSGTYPSTYPGMQAPSPYTRVRRYGRRITNEARWITAVSDVR